MARDFHTNRTATDLENVDDIENISQNAVEKLTKDLKNATATLSPAEARYLVDAYYTLQNDRIRAKNRVRAFSEGKEPHEVITWLSDNTGYLEKQIGRALTAYAESNPVGKWSMSITGVAGVISVGLLAHIDIEKSPTVGHIYSFAGILPELKWEKGQKRPFNAQLKTLCWKIGESFVKVSNNKNDYYGKVYKEAKDYLIEKNESGEFGEQSAKILTEKKFGKETEAFGHYSAGHLPPAHIHARAKRKAVKLFLSHWHAVAYQYHYGKPAPLPYVIEHLGHVHYIEIPNNPFAK